MPSPFPGMNPFLEMLHRVYDAGRYVHYVYEGRPKPPLPPEDEEWARPFMPATT
jgi:hypothetical protein